MGSQRIRHDWATFTMSYIIWPQISFQLSLLSPCLSSLQAQYSFLFPLSEQHTSRSQTLSQWCSLGRKWPEIPSFIAHQDHSLLSRSNQILPQSEMIWPSFLYLCTFIGAFISCLFHSALHFSQWFMILFSIRLLLICKCLWWMPSQMTSYSSHLIYICWNQANTK